MRPGGPTEAAINRNLMRVSFADGGGNNGYDPNQPRDDIGRQTAGRGSGREEPVRRQDNSLASKALDGVEQGWDYVVDKWDYFQHTLEDAKNAPADLLTGCWENTQETGDVLSDFYTNYQDMKEAGFIGGDKYFHCKANCQAAQKGERAKKSAAALSNLREVQGFFKGDARADSAEDQEVNNIGRRVGKSYPDRSCRDLCRPYRPKKLPNKY